MGVSLGVNLTLPVWIITQVTVCTLLNAGKMCFIAELNGFGQPLKVQLFLSNLIDLLELYIFYEDRTRFAEYTIFSMSCYFNHY